MLFRFVFLSVLVLSVLSGFSQNKQAFIKAGDKAFEKADYYSATVYYKQAILDDKPDLEHAYKYAQASRMFNNYEEAQKWYQYIIRSGSQNQFTDAAFWHAMMTKMLGDYDGALEIFSQLESKLPSDDTSYLARKIKIEVMACKTAENIINDSLNISINHLSNRINTKYSDFSARTGADNALYFSSLKYSTRPDSKGKSYFVSRIIRAENGGMGQQRPKELESTVNASREHNSNPFITPDGKWLYFTRCTPGDPSDVVCSIFRSEYANGKWLKATSLGEHINMKGFTSTQPAFYHDKDDTGTLFFVSDRPGGYGKLDLWSSRLSSESKFEEPVNLGPVLNTADNEVSPVFDIKTQELYFSSEWHPGLGGYDIFRSKKDSMGWHTPINIGYPLNSSYNDIYYNPENTARTKTGLLSSNRKGSLSFAGEACCYDIYRYTFEDEPLPELPEDTVKPEPRNLRNLISLLPVRLYFHNDEPDCCNLNTTTKKTYNQSFDEYVKLVPEYKNEFSSGLSRKDRDKTRDSIDVFFDEHVVFGKSVLDDFASMLLEDLATGSQYTVVLKGFTSPLAKTEYNHNLARRRISSLKNYFNEHQNGAFRKFLEPDSTGIIALKLNEDPVGETKANPLVSDNLKDKRNSVYNPAAAIERRIEIIAVKAND